MHRWFVFVCYRLLPVFLTKTETVILYDRTPIVFVFSLLFKYGTFFCNINPKEFYPWTSISVWMIKKLMTDELIAVLGWGPCIFVCSSTVNANVSTQIQTTPQTCRPSRAVCRHQVKHIIHTLFTFIPTHISTRRDHEESCLMRKQHVSNQLERLGRNCANHSKAIIGRGCLWYRLVSFCQLAHMARGKPCLPVNGS